MLLQQIFLNISVIKILLSQLTKMLVVGNRQMIHVYVHMTLFQKKARLS
jgi:hypothetical protein